MSKIFTVIVDDERDSRKTLHNFLLRYCPDIEVAAEAGSVPEAEQVILKTAPQLVFLDINMPLGNGFELFDRIPDPGFYTVFVTAYDEYALRAFKHHAVAYILKPIDINELIATVGRVKEMQDLKTSVHRLRSLLQDIPRPVVQDRITLPVSDGLIYVQLDDIIRCEAAANYTHIYFTNRNKILVSRSLGVYEEMLSGRGFARVHHHHLINLKHVEKYQRGRGGVVIMSDKKEIDVSQRRRDDFLKLLEGGF